MFSTKKSIPFLSNFFAKLDIFSKSLLYIMLLHTFLSICNSSHRSFNSFDDNSYNLLGVSIMFNNFLILPFRNPSILHNHNQYNSLFKFSLYPFQINIFLHIFITHSICQCLHQMININIIRFFNISYSSSHLNNLIISSDT